MHASEYVQVSEEIDMTVQAGQPPPWVACRESKCDKCGWERKYPPCPALLKVPSVSFRVLGSAAEYVGWLENPKGPEPPRKKVTKVDQLVSVTASAPVFFSYLAERMQSWVPHWAIDDHQLKVRGRSVRAVSEAGIGERLEILVDWSEKLSLDPQNSVTGGQYEKVGVVVAVCVYRGADGARTETVAGICEKPTNDVPHTHAFLRKLIAQYAQRSLELGKRLQCVNIWSDGGQAHFKCAEGFAFCSHLLRELREVACNPDARLTWNFMQSYHGKGPYDAEVRSKRF